MKYLYLSICGIKILCKFVNSERNILTKDSERIYRRIYSSYSVPPFKKADITIKFIDTHWKMMEDVKLKHEHYVKFYEQNGNIITTYYSISVFHFELIIANIINSFIAKKGIIPIHGSSVLVENKAYIFLGRSGAGKSTIASLLSSRYKVLADDHLFISKHEKNFVLYQTPLVEKPINKRGAKEFPVGGFFFLRKNTDCKIVKIDEKVKTYQLLQKQLLMVEKMGEKNFKSITDLVNNNDFYYYLYFPKSSRKINEELLKLSRAT